MTLLLSFYSSACLGRYLAGYDACQALKNAVIDLVTVAVSTPRCSPCRSEAATSCTRPYDHSREF